MQAIILNTILDAFPVRVAPWRPFAVGAGLIAGGIAFLVLMRRQRSRFVTVTTALIAAHVAAAVSVFVVVQVLWPVAGPVLSLLLGLGAAVACRGRWGTPPAQERS